jgi:hypothetical protein
MKGYETDTSAPVLLFVQFLGRVVVTGTDSIHIWQPSKHDRLDCCYSKLAHENNFENATHFSVPTAQAATVLSCLQRNETDIPIRRSDNGNKKV